MSRILMTIIKTYAYGSNRMMLQYASALKSAGHDVSVAYEHPPQSDATSTESILSGVEAAGLPMIHVPHLARSVLSRGGGSLGREVRRRGFDLLISNELRDTAATMSVAHTLELPGVAFVQGPPFFQGAGPSKMAKRFVYSRAVRKHATRIIGVSPVVQKRLTEDYGVDPTKCKVIMNGIDLEKLPPEIPQARASLRSEFNVTDADRLLLTIGRFDRVKGLDVLIDAVHQAVTKHALPLRLLIAAEANSRETAAYRTSLETMVRNLNLTDRITFIGYRNDCHRLLRGADGFVMASRSEGFPLAVLESFAAECPVIMTDFALRFPGFRDNHEGLEVPVEDASALCNAIAKLMTLSEMDRQQIGKNGRGYLDRHPTIAQSNQEFVDEIESVLSQASNAQENNSSTVPKTLSKLRSSA